VSTHEQLTVQYHQQDTDYYCGAACAQMVLAEIGAGLLDQDDLYADNHSHSTTESGWYTAPDGLTWTLNARRPASFGSWFVLFALGSEDLASRKLCWTIHHYQVGPVAMVFGSAHWIVVRGYEASQAPSSSADTSYSISAFDVNNPWPPTPTPGPPPPHSDGDVCGSGGDRGLADEHIAYSTWQSDYMTGITGGHWNGTFVTVCDPEPPAEIPGASRPERRLEGRTLLTPAAAAKRATAALERFRLAEREQWRRALQRTDAGDPVLVQRLDRLDDFYYVVPMHRSATRVSAFVSVDARFGTYKQSAAPREPRPLTLLAAARREVLEHVAGRRFDLEDGAGRLLVRPETVCVHPTLVWKPCRESLSPFWPFHLITVGANRLYVRVDGAVFTALHEADRGI